MEKQTNTIKTADFIIKPDLGEIEVNNKTVRLGPVNMKVLLKLVNQADRVISRSEMFDSVWKNLVISDDASTKSISEIRTKLGQNSHYKKLIQTIPKKGYQWSPSDYDKPTQTESTTKPQVKELAKTYVKNTVLVIVSVMVLATSFLWIANKSVEIKHLPILLMPIETHDQNQQTNANNLEDSLRKNIITSKNIRFLSKAALNSSSRYSIFNQENNYKAQWAIELEKYKTH